MTLFVAKEPLGGTTPVKLKMSCSPLLLYAYMLVCLDTMSFMSAPLSVKGSTRGPSTSIEVSGQYIQLSACPLKQCHVNAQTDINCAISGCTQISTEFPPDVGKLSLRGNNITYISRLPYKKLKELDLSNNAISDIHEDAFNELENLVSLHLSGNRISVLKNSYFLTLNNLKYLHLDHNILTHIPSNVFVPSLESLQILDLSQNAISSIEEHAFAGVSSLMFLHLQKNNISSIGRKHLQNLTQLEDLFLKENRIKHLGPHTFAELHSLRMLDLSFNDLRTLANNSFALKDPDKESKLMRLDLGKNRISALHEGVFNGLKYLRTLKLEYNQINRLPSHVLPKGLVNFTLHHMPNLEHIERQAFAGLTKLQYVKITRNKQLSKISREAFDVEFQAMRLLDLSSNNLSSLSRDILANWSKVEWTNLSGNPWLCDCNVLWMKEVHMKPTDNDATRCHSPPSLHGNQLTKVPDYELSCGKLSHARDPRSFLGIGVVVLTILLLLSIVAAALYRCRHKVICRRHGHQTGYSALYNPSSTDGERELEISKIKTISEEEEQTLETQNTMDAPETVPS